MRRLSTAAARYPRRLRPAANGAMGYWSNPSTWGGAVPGDGDAVTIPGGQTIILDCDTARLGPVTSAGNLIVDPTKDIHMTAHSLNITTGSFQIGSESNPYLRNFRLTLTGAESGRAARFAPDVTATSGAGNGTLLNLLQGAGAVAETYTITFTSATAFGVVGSVSGSLGTGTVGVLFNNKIQFTAIAGTTPWANTHSITVVQEQRGFTNDGVGRSIQKQPEGTLIVIGKPMEHVRTKLDAHLTAGAQALTFADAVMWGKGERLVVGPTDYYNTGAYPSGNCERVWLKSSTGGTTRDITGPVTNPKWGRLQYATDAGPSLTPGTLTNTEGTSAEDWAKILERSVLDQRAPVLNLSRNIVFEGVDDAAWQNDGFGLHIMVMGAASTVKVDGVEIRRCGQAGAIGRYPFHWHMMSYTMPGGMNYPSDGTFINGTLAASLATGQYLKNSAIHTSSQRAIVIHGTCGVTVDNNNCHDILGMAVFLEDGAEHKNTITNNVVMKVRAPAAGNRILDMDATPAGFWLTSPDNTIEGNTACDCAGIGIWNAWGGDKPMGLCRNVPFRAKHTPLISYRNNTGHSCGESGIKTNNFQNNERGNVALESKYDPRPNSVNPDSNAVGESLRVMFFRNTIWKCTNAYSNRVFVPIYQEFQFADNADQDARGQAGYLENAALFKCHVSFGSSLNTSASPVDVTKYPRAAVASYNMGIDIEDCVYINYPSAQATQPPSTGAVMLHGGIFRTDDQYFHPIEIANDFKRIKKINSSMGYVSRPKNYDGLGPTQQHSTLSFSTHDPNHHWTAYDTNIMDHAFYTYGAAGAADAPSGRFGTNDMYYGMAPSSSNLDVGNPLMELDVRRYDGVTEVGQMIVREGRSDIPSSDGTYGYASLNLANMRHFGVAKNGKYSVFFPTRSAPNVNLSWSVDFAYRPTDSFVVSLPWANGVTARGWISSQNQNQFSDPGGTDISSGRALALAVLGSQAAVEASLVPAMWQDTTNNRVWVKYFGGRSVPSSGTWSTNSQYDGMGTNWGDYLRAHYIILRA